jgi:hypothetical protein
MMSEGHRIYVSNDETQIMIDVNSGKYYSFYQIISIQITEINDINR